MAKLQRLPNGKLLSVGPKLAVECCCAPIDNDPCGLPTSWSATISASPFYAFNFSPPTATNLAACDPDSRVYCVSNPGTGFQRTFWYGHDMTPLNGTRNIPFSSVSGPTYSWVRGVISVADFRYISWAVWLIGSSCVNRIGSQYARMTINATCPSIGPGDFTVSATLQALDSGTGLPISGAIVAGWNKTVSLTAGQKLKFYGPITMNRSGGLADSLGRPTHYAARHAFNVGCSTPAFASPIEYPSLVLTPVP